MPPKSKSANGLRRYATSMVYAKSSGDVLHVSHVDAIEGSTPPKEFLSQIEHNAIDEACRVHGIPRDELAIVSLDPKKFKSSVIYSVDLATGKLKTKPIRRTRGRSSGK